MKPTQEAIDAAKFAAGDAVTELLISHADAGLDHPRSQTIADDAVDAALKVLVAEFERIRKALLSPAIIEPIAKARCIEALYGHWEDFPAREANQELRYAQLSEDVKESYRRPVRENIEQALGGVEALEA